MRVQPGVVLRELTRRLAAGRPTFRPRPAHQECTLGGMLATNASGTRAFKHGYTRDHVERLRVVLDSGDVAEAGWQSRWSAAETPHGRLEDIVSSVVTLLHENAELLTSDLPRTRFNRCGYLLHDVLARRRLESGPAAGRLRGNAGVVHRSDAAHHSAARRPCPGAARLREPGRGAAGGSVRAAERPGGLRTDRPPAADAGAAATRKSAALIPPRTEAVLLVEYEADSPKEAARAALELADHLHRWERLALLARVAVEADDIERLWQVREAALPSLYGLRGARSRWPSSRTLACPPSAGGIICISVQEVLQRHETTASYLIHAATGQVHMRPFLDLRRREDVARLWPLADELYTVVLELGGTISTQHGTGLARTPWVSRQYGRLYPVFREAKGDLRSAPSAQSRQDRRPGAGNAGLAAAQHETKPEVVTNGSVAELVRVREPESATSATNAPGYVAELARVPRTGSLATSAANGESAPQLHWTPLEIADESHSCNGCGQCRTESPPQRMCPIFRATHAEAATPRAKANLMRHLLHPDTDPHLLSSARCARSPTCASIARCARANVRPTSTCPS